MQRHDTSYRTITLPITVCIVVSFISHYLRVSTGNDNYLIIAIYFWTASLYGYGEYDRRHKDNPPKHPVLTAQFLCIVYVPYIVLKKLTFRK